MWRSRESNPSQKALRFTLSKWLAEGFAVDGALCYYNKCDSWPSESNGGKKRNNRTFTKAPLNVKSLLTLWRWVSAVLSEVPDFWKSLYYLSLKLHYLICQCVFVNQRILCWCVQCPEKTPASPWPRVSTSFPPRWTQQESGSQGKTAVRGTHEDVNEEVVLMGCCLYLRLNDF